MTKLRKPVEIESAFARYKLSELLGQGGAGRVLGGETEDGTPVAVKILNSDRVTSETRKRFKNEIAFLLNNQHNNIVRVTDHGVSSVVDYSGPFYVMNRYDGNLRSAWQKNGDSESKLQSFFQILDGVEAAHLKGAVHRDLKPENILFADTENRLAIADFGIAQFTERELLATTVETGAGQRLANFAYAAPEQRTPGKSINLRTDIYALGLILVESMTGEVPHGQGFTTIGSVFPDFKFLDPIAIKMLAQNPVDRYETIGAVKLDIQKYRTEAIALQRVDVISKTVVREDEITDPLAIEPPKIIDVDWKDDYLHLTLNLQPSQGWIHAFQNLGNYHSFMGAGPSTVAWRGSVALIRTRSQDAQQQVNMFKDWIVATTQNFRNTLQHEARRKAENRRQELARARHAEEERAKVIGTLKF